MNPSGLRSPGKVWTVFAVIGGAALTTALIIGSSIFRSDRAREAGPGPLPTVAGGASANFTTLQSPVTNGRAPKVGEPAPDFSLKTLDSGQVTLSALRGQPVLINFWATWCPPCRLEMPALVRVYEAHKAEGFVILGVNLTVQDSLPDVQAFVQEFNMTFPVLLDEEGVVAENLYRLPGLPMSVFVNRDGIIKSVHIGGMTGEQIDQLVKEILK